MGEELAVSLSIVRTIADREGVDPTELPPLYEVIDPDALDGLVDRNTGDRIVVRFTYSGHVVTVETDDEPTVSIEPSAPTSANPNASESPT